LVDKVYSYPHLSGEQRGRDKTSSQKKRKRGGRAQFIRGGRELEICKIEKAAAPSIR